MIGVIRIPILFTGQHNIAVQIVEQVIAAEIRSGFRGCGLGAVRGDSGSDQSYSQTHYRKVFRILNAVLVLIIKRIVADSAFGQIQHTFDLLVFWSVG